MSVETRYRDSHQLKDADILNAAHEPIGLMSSDVMVSENEWSMLLLVSLMGAGSGWSGHEVAFRISSSFSGDQRWSTPFS
jgi:hypothetical protein